MRMQTRWMVVALLLSANAPASAAQSMTQLRDKVDALKSAFQTAKQNAMKPKQGKPFVLLGQHDGASGIGSSIRVESHTEEGKKTFAIKIGRTGRLKQEGAANTEVPLGQQRRFTLFSVKTRGLKLSEQGTALGDFAEVQLKNGDIEGAQAVVVRMEELKRQLVKMNLAPKTINLAEVQARLHGLKLDEK